MDIKNIIIGGLGLVVVGLIYFGNIQNRKIAVQNNLITASTDTLHKFKTIVGNQGEYISTLVGDRSNLIAILDIKDKNNSINLEIIDSLKKDKNIQSIAVISTNTKSDVSHKVDTIYKEVTFKDSISNKWYDASIDVNKGISRWKLNQRDQINLTTTNKPNRGLFSGKTLTTYATSDNPNTNIIGVTSVSTVIDKRKIRVSPTIGLGLNSDLQGKNIRLGYQIGISVSF